ncbi:unnamed protein product [Bursaphelenchus xylophilus]|uniref:acid phosphatase n=1 Tax=Bursaphelenchus xylophilus TaxID=6326 RepID=A0A1I7RST1_BURXY|nr:unnamed protein product [Bursaphelenchus xylophilus]CAG9122812.1 unnamed protein product [Bursaphelenchus xylophilus]
MKKSGLSLSSRILKRPSDPCLDLFFIMIVLAVIFGLLIWNSFSVHAKPELILVQVLFRHGLRTPLEVYPTDPNLESWPKELGGLTDEGREQQRQLARFLRERYQEFLHKKYDDKEVKVRSSNKSRTIESAKINLRTTFNGSQDDLWPEISTVDYKQDYLLNARSNCKRRLELWDLFHQAPEYKEAENTYKSLLLNLSEHSKMTLTLDNYWVIEELTEIEIRLNKPVPKWVQENYKALKALNHRVLNFTNGFSLSPYKGIDFSLEVPKLIGGPIWKEITERADAKINCHNSKDVGCKSVNDLRYYVYSGHDMIISAIFGILGGKMNLDKDGYPGPASSVIFELWSNQKSQPTFKVFYRDDTGNVVDVLEHLGIKGWSFDELKNRTHRFIPPVSSEEFCNTSLNWK